MPAQRRDANQLLTMKEVLERLQIGQSTLYRLIREDPTFRTLRIGRARRMRESELAKWVERQEALEE